MNKISWKNYNQDDLTIVVKTDNDITEYNLNMRIIENKRYKTVEDQMRIMEQQLNKWYSFREVNQEIIENFLYFNGYCEYLEES